MVFRSKAHCFTRDGNGFFNGRFDIGSEAPPPVTITEMYSQIVQTISPCWITFRSRFHGLAANIDGLVKVAHGASPTISVHEHNCEVVEDYR
jgi:hypothetical protein